MTPSDSLSDRTVRKVCWGCGARFICGPQGEDAACWCAAAAPLSPRDGADCLCPTCLQGKIVEQEASAACATNDTRPPLKEGEDYYCDGPAIVFTARYLLRRGFCCGNGCRHCPYDKAALR